MISGRITEKKGYLYAILNIKDEQGKRKTKWVATHLKAKGNKKQAEEILFELRRKYTAEQAMSNRSNGVYFDSFMEAWLESCRGKISDKTFSGYHDLIRNKIVLYFKEKNILLSKFTEDDIETFYDGLYKKGLSGNTVLHYHVVIRMALQEAFKKGLIPYNYADRIERPKKEQYIAKHYSVEECNHLLTAVKGDALEMVVKLALFYGLRRSEALGLRWSAIDFSDKTISINHSVSSVFINGSYQLYKKDKVKRLSSFRTLPLVEPVEMILKDEIERRYGKNTPPPNDYICVNRKGGLFNPNDVSMRFSKFLKKHNLRHIRFHDLRHSCANLLISARVPLIEVQQWLGHSDFSTTANLYSHLTYETKLRSAEELKKLII